MLRARGTLPREAAAQRAQELADARAAAVLGNSMRSLSSWESAMRAWLLFAAQRLGRAGDELPPTPDELCLWALDFRSAGTFANYRAQVEKSCRLLGLDCSAFGSAEVVRAKKALLKRCARPKVEPPPILHPLLVKMLGAVAQPDTAALYILSFAFALRVPSEALPMVVGDPAAAGSFTFTAKERRDPRTRAVLFCSGDAVVVHLSRRKHAPFPCRLVRKCWCEACARTCPVHAAESFLESAPVGVALWARQRHVSKRGFVSATAALRSTIRSHASAAGAEAPELFNTRSFRRGHADSVARFGGKLSTILRAGNWSSRAFKE